MPRSRVLAALLAAIVPSLLAVMLCERLFDRPFEHAIPYIDDEVAYWLQASAFSRAGFSAGYFTINEVPAAAAFSRFGPHGPLFPMIVGSVGRVAGWRPYSLPLVGVALVACAAAFAAWRLRLTAWTGTLALATFWPLIIALPMSMQESLHFAFALALAPLVWTVLTSNPARLASLVAVVLALSVASLVRPTWMLVLIPIAWMVTSDRPVRCRALAVTAAVLLTGITYLLFAWMSAPIQPAGLVERASSNPLLFVSGSGMHAVANVRYLLTESELAEQLWHAEAVVLCAVCLAGWSTRRGREANVFGAGLLLCVLLVVLMLYTVDGWRSFRVLGAPMLLVLMIGVAAGARWSRWVIVAHLALAPVYLAAFVELNEPRFRADRSRIPHFRRELEGVVVFQQDASPWQNTLLVQSDAVDFTLVGLPPGIGLSVVPRWEQVRVPVRSGYLLMTDEQAEQVRTRVRIEPVKDTIAGTIYRNLDAW